MKYTFALAAVFAGLAAAQSTTGSAALPIPTSDIPPCILQCVTQSASSAGCSGIADINCICTSDAFLQAATECVTSKCPDQAAQALQLQSQLCEAAPSGSQSASETASATSTSRVSTATAPTTSGTASASHASGSSHASSALSSASSVLSSLSSAAASATNSPNAAVGVPAFNLAATGVWAAVALGGAAVAQLVL